MIMRHSYSQPEHSYGEAPYDSTYAPHGITEVNLTGLINTYTPVQGATQSYFPARVRITAQDFPMDDPMREVVLSGIDDVRDAGGAPIPFAWPAGTVLTIQAEPYAHPAGFDHILLAWNTSPGTAINHCPTPEQEHSFTVPPLDTGLSLELSLVTGVVHQYVGAMVELPIPDVQFDVTFSQSHGTATYSYQEAGIFVSHNRVVIGPKGATQEMEVSFHEHQSRRMERVLGGMGWAYAAMFVDGNYVYPPFNGSDPRSIPINAHGDMGDTLLTLLDEFMSGQVEVQPGSNPHNPLVVANPALSPGSGTMRSSDNTAIVQLLSQSDPQTNLLTLYDAYAVPTVSVETDVILVDHEGNEVQASVPPGFVTDPYKYSFDPGDDRFSTFMQPSGRPGETALVEAISNPMFNHTGWIVDGIEYDLEGNELDGGQKMMKNGSTHYQLTFMGSQLAIGWWGRKEPVEVEAKWRRFSILVSSGESTRLFPSFLPNWGSWGEIEPIAIDVKNIFDSKEFYNGYYSGFVVGSIPSSKAEFLNELKSPFLDIVYIAGHSNKKGIRFTDGGSSSKRLSKADLITIYGEEHIKNNPYHIVVHVTACDSLNIFNIDDWSTIVYISWQGKVSQLHAQRGDVLFWQLIGTNKYSFNVAATNVNNEMVRDPKILSKYNKSDPDIPKITVSFRKNVNDNFYKTIWQNYRWNN